MPRLEVKVRVSVLFSSTRRSRWTYRLYVQLYNLKVKVTGWQRIDASQAMVRAICSVLSSQCHVRVSWTAGLAQITLKQNTTVLRSRQKEHVSLCTFSLGAFSERRRIGSLSADVVSRHNCDNTPTSTEPWRHDLLNAGRSQSDTKGSFWTFCVQPANKKFDVFWLASYEERTITKDRYKQRQLQTEGV